MRGVGDVTLGAFVERLLDMVAIKLDMDPLEFRLKNHTRTGDELLSMRSFLDEDQLSSLEEPICLSSDALHECMEKGAQAFGWKEKWKGWGKPYSIEGPKRLGAGMAAGVCVNGDDARGNVSALVRVHQDGSATLFCSMGRIGQGSETTQAQIAAETLGMSIYQIRVEGGDTLVTPWSHGSAASNTACRTGFATMSACLDAKSQILDIASKYHFGSDPGELDIKQDRIYQKSDPKKSIPLGEMLSEPIPDTFSPPVIIGRPVKSMPNSLAIRNYGVHFVGVEVDTDTGKISIIDYVAAQDSGTVLNPKVLENQVVGGAILSSGFALVESLAFDPQTGRILNPGFMDYKVFRAPDFPLQPTTILCEPYDPVGPYGVKGAGEVPANVPIPAISQAVYNAIGVWMDVPMTPQRVLSALGKI
jgi:CO/xanthine dehydrogenase Mo-binding subunit